MTGLDKLARALAENVEVVESFKRFAGAPVAMGSREQEGGVLEEGHSPTLKTGGSFDGTPDVPGREASIGVPSRPDSDPEARLLDMLMPRETAEGALRVFDRFALGDQGPVYAMQRAFQYMATAEHWHRHLRGGGR